MFLLHVRVQGGVREISLVTVLALVISALDVVLASPLGLGLVLVIRIVSIYTSLVLVRCIKITALTRRILLLGRVLRIVLVLLVLVSHWNRHHAWLGVLLHHVWVHWHLLLVVHRNLQTNIKSRRSLYVLYNFLISLPF